MECSSEYISTVWTKQRVGTRTINCFSVSKKIVALNVARHSNAFQQRSRRSNLQNCETVTVAKSHIGNSSLDQEKGCT